MAGRIAAVVTIASCSGQSAPRGKGHEQSVDVLLGAEEMLLDEGVLPASRSEGLRTSNLPPVPPVLRLRTHFAGGTGGKSNVTNSPLPGVPGVERAFAGVMGVRRRRLRLSLPARSLQPLTRTVTRDRERRGSEADSSLLSNHRNPYYPIYGINGYGGPQHIVQQEAGPFGRAGKLLRKD